MGIYYKRELKMKKYKYILIKEYVFNRHVEIEAATKEEAQEKADTLLFDACFDFSNDDYELTYQNADMEE